MSWDDQVRQALGDRLKTDSITSVAVEAGMTRPQLSAYLHGKRGLSSESLERLARLLGFDIVRP